MGHCCHQRSSLAMGPWTDVRMLGCANGEGKRPLWPMSLSPSAWTSDPQSPLCRIAGISRDGDAITHPHPQSGLRYHLAKGHVAFQAPQNLEILRAFYLPSCSQHLNHSGVGTPVRDAGSGAEPGHRGPDPYSGWVCSAFGL